MPDKEKRIELDREGTIKNKEQIFNLSPEQLKDLKPGSYTITEDGKLIPKDEANSAEKS